MRILALEFSSARRSVAVFQRGTKPIGLATLSTERSTRAFALIDEVLAEARVAREQIECLTVGLGPGSYTGIRVAIAIAQGWQLAKGIKLLGVSSVDAIAGQARAEGMTGRVTVAVDAQRREFYVAQYNLDAAPPAAETALGIETFDQLQERSARGEVIIGPERTDDHVIFPDAEVLAELAVNRVDFVAGESLEPIYLRETTFVKAAPPRPRAVVP